MASKFYRAELTNAREVAGLTRAQLAKRIGISRHFVVEVENGHKDPGYRTMIAWARALGRHGSLELFGQLSPKTGSGREATAAEVA
jgi:transcriptional regulator with XRE-family HTH domain